MLRPERPAATLAVLLLVLHTALQAAATDIFERTNLIHLSIQLPVESVRSLEQSPRKYVSGTLSEGTNRYETVAFRLKGTSSFQPIDKKPSFTIAFNRTSTNQTFHGLTKIHLNNSVEDPTYLNEWIGSRMFNAAGAPAPRVTHAAIKLNGRNLDIYVLKEGFTEEFLARHFRRADGNLYEGGSAAAGAPDITDPMHRNLGEGPLNRLDLQGLAKACLEQDLQKRWEKISQRLDIDRFISFLAMEVMLGHRDGYALARNNYRLYHNPETARFVFLPTGMDQLFGRADLPISPHMSGVAVGAVMETKHGNALYAKRFSELFQTVFKLEDLTNSVVSRSKLLSQEINKPREHANAVQELNARIVARWKNIQRQLDIGPPTPLPFTNGIVLLTGWQKWNPPPAGKMELAADKLGSLWVHCGPRTAASWRKTVFLDPGKYGFSASVTTKGLRPLPFGKNHGAGLRIDIKGRVLQTALLQGTTPPTTLEVAFEVRNANERIDLFCTVRGNDGEVWFDVPTLRVAGD